MNMIVPRHKSHRSQAFCLMTILSLVVGAVLNAGMYIPFAAAVHDSNAEESFDSDPPTELEVAGSSENIAIHYSAKRLRGAFPKSLARKQRDVAMGAVATSTHLVGRANVSLRCSHLCDQARHERSGVLLV